MEAFTLEWTPQTVPGTLDAGSTAPVRVGSWTEKGYDFIRDAGAAFTGNLEGSVCGLNWSVVASLAASAQGTIAVHYNWLRVTISVSGALGATTQLRVRSSDGCSARGSAGHRG